jgi:hypothetical protein
MKLLWSGKIEGDTWVYRVGLENGRIVTEMLPPFEDKWMRFSFSSTRTRERVLEATVLSLLQKKAKR